MRMMVKLFVAAGLALTATNAPAAVQIIDSNGILTGATGVDVGGTLYDVAFLDGTCVSGFDGCNAQTDFNLFKRRAKL